VPNFERPRSFDVMIRISLKMKTDTVTVEARPAARGLKTQRLYDDNRNAM